MAVAFKTAHHLQSLCGAYGECSWVIEARMVSDVLNATVIPKGEIARLPLMPVDGVRTGVVRVHLGEQRVGLCLVHAFNAGRQLRVDEN